MRLIDADALIPTEVHTVVVLKDGREQLESVLYAEQVDYAPTVEPASPWHRVEELPKEAAQYFVIWENNGDRGGGAAWFSLRLGWIWGGPKITHWMPIEPPKEVQIIKSVMMREGDTDTDGFFRKAVEAVKKVQK